VVNHPHLVPDFAPEEDLGGSAAVDALLAASGKLQLLERLLSLLLGQGQVRARRPPCPPAPPPAPSPHPLPAHAACVLPPTV
jgi:hypothetical protein